VVLWFECIPRDARVALEHVISAGESGAALRTRCGAGQLERTLLESAPSLAACSLQRHDNAIELTEREPEPVLPLWIFGAGHVGRAVVRLLDDLPQFDVLWLDSRAGALPAAAAHIHGQILAEPVEKIARAPQGTAFLVLTHDHELDYQICSAVLKREDATWLGLIGSQSKAARFRSRLRRDGFTDAQVGKLCSPVGQTNLRSKLPAAIAVSIVAQLLTLEARPVKACAVAACDPQCRRCAAPLAVTELP
jgi:xanthine dehydrogenase accessory factor